MPNIQVIDGADNCTYDVFAATDDEFGGIFPDGQDIEFIEDLIVRVGEKTAEQVMSPIWKRPVDKKSVCGIHGTLFYELSWKKKFYPTKKENEMLTGAALIEAINAQNSSS